MNERLKFGDQTFIRDMGGKSPAYFPLDETVRIDATIVARLKQLAVDEYGGQLRLNLHGDAKSDLHEMIIIESKGAPRKIHKHAYKDESYQIIEGAMEVRLYDDEGRLTRTERLEAGGDMTFLFRVGKGRWHRTVPILDVVVYKESRSGPFEGGDSIEFDRELEDV